MTRLCRDLDQLGCDLGLDIVVVEGHPHLLGELHGLGNEHQDLVFGDVSDKSLLTDCHCHPQLDPAHMQAVQQLRASSLAAMSVSHDVDWAIMQQLHQLAGTACVASERGSGRLWRR